VICEGLFVLKRGQAGGSRLAALRDFVRVRPGRDRAEVWRWRDPAPFLVETLQWLRLLPRETPHEAQAGVGCVAHERV